MTALAWRSCGQLHSGVFTGGAARCRTEPRNATLGEQTPGRRSDDGGGDEEREHMKDRGGGGEEVERRWGGREGSRCWRTRGGKNNKQRYIKSFTSASTPR
ncbi:hypothetical protein EYF80_020783 [Liparis tanakae]|uniref:Uncharacterized protein n=1 Tax=Liparis tanakae TaxID=230148 RepID=A0A4Z2HVI7_9TELE|nr:hypothetical protein EYF80_020783 [Liparis tanakae]